MSRMKDVVEWVWKTPEGRYLVRKAAEAIKAVFEDEEAKKLDDE